MKRTRRTLWWMVAGPAVVLAAIMLEAFPFLAITEPSGGKVLVVEGWMDPGALREAAQLVLDSGYTRVYSTGTVRAFAYYLEPGQGISVEPHDTLSGKVDINVSGTTHAGFLLIADGDTVLDQAVTPHPRNYHAVLPRTAERIRVVAWPIHADPGTPVIYVAGCNVNGANINLLQQRSWFTRPDSPAAPAWPTYAQSARDALIRAGVPSGMVTAVPAYGTPRSRTWGNANAFGIQARQDGIPAFDVATVGVHARRSRNLFQAACGPEVHVGVVALTDPFCTKANWWRSYRGWYTMLKEVVGAPELKAVELTR